MSVKTYKLHGSYSTVPGGSLHDANKTIEVELDDKDFHYLNHNEAARNKYFQDHVIHATKVFSTSFEQGLFGNVKTFDKAENNGGSFAASNETKSKEGLGSKIVSSIKESNQRAKDAEAQKHMESRAEAKSQIEELKSFEYSSSDINENLGHLFALFSLIESTSDYDPDKTELVNYATSKFKLGLDICKGIDPSNASVKMLEEKFNTREEGKKKKQKRAIILGIAFFVLFFLIMRFIA